MQTFANGLYAGASYSLVALAVTLVFHTARNFPIGLAIPYTCSAYAAYTLTTNLGVNLWVAAVAGILCGGAVGLLLDSAMYRALRAKAASPTAFLLSSLGMVAAFQSVVSLAYGDQTQVLRPQPEVSSRLILGAHLTGIQISTIAAAGLAFAAVVFLGRYTTIGRMRRALAADATLAAITGIPVERIHSLVYVFSSILVGIAAILSALDTDIIPAMGFGAVLMGVVACIVGGIGSPGGAILGCFLIGMAQHFGVKYVSTQWQDAVAFLILVTFLVFRPRGFWGLQRAKAY